MKQFYTFVIIFSLLFHTLNVSAISDFAKNNTTFVELLQGVKINLVAPGAGMDKKFMSKLGDVKDINLNIPKHCFNNPISLHSASDEIRFQCLKEAILDGSTNIIWALRGGYGAAKLIPELRKLPKPAIKKILIGYSDITALHLFFTQEWGWTTIHGDMIAELVSNVLGVDKDRNNFVNIAKIITGKVMRPKIKGLIALNQVAKDTKRISGRITGGNLTIVETSIGTDWQIKPHDKILFFEDVHIKPFQLDRALLHLKQAHIFDNAKAIILGNFDQNKEDVFDVLKNFASSMNIPIFKTDRIGHSAVNDPIIYNSNCEITKSSAKAFTLVMTNLLK